MIVRACLEIGKGAAAKDFGCGGSSEVREPPQRAVRTEPTKPTDKRPAARRVFAPQAGWLRCSSVEDPPGIFSFVAPRHPACGAKTAPFPVFSQAQKARKNHASGPCHFNKKQTPLASLPNHPP